MLTILELVDELLSVVSLGLTLIVVDLVNTGKGLELNVCVVAVTDVVLLNEWVVTIDE